MIYTVLREKVSRSTYCFLEAKQASTCKKKRGKKGIQKASKSTTALGVCYVHFTTNGLLKIDAGFIDQVAFFG